MSSFNPLLWPKPPVVWGYGIAVLSVTGSWAWRPAGRDALHLSEEEWYRIYAFDSEDGVPDWEERLQRIHPAD
jgi:hypothetical protein